MNKAVLLNKTALFLAKNSPIRNSDIAHITLHDKNINYNNNRNETG